MPLRQRLVSLCAAVLIAGCSSGAGETREATRARQAPREVQAVSVAVAPAQRRDLERRVTVTGPVEPVRRIQVASQSAGTVVRVEVMEGDSVAKERLLAALDDREIAAQLRRAEAVLTNAATAFDRVRALHQDSIISDLEFEESRAAYEVAQSDVAIWRTRMNFTRIVAPSEGVITVKYIEAGSAVSQNQIVFELADISLLVVRVQVSELDVVYLSAGEPVEVQLDAFPDARIPGTIRRIFPAADPQSRLVPVEVALGPVRRGLDVRPGFLARTTFRLDRRPGALVVPAAAVSVVGDETFVYLVEADTLVRRAVRLGLSAEGSVQVTDGVAEGDWLVTSGQAALRQGARVRVMGGTVE